VIHPRFVRPLAACAALLAFAAPVHAARDVGDGTTMDGWTLANGLRVVVHDIPGAGSAAIVVAYPNGRDGDPTGQEGRAALMAEIAFTAAAGEVPARTHEDLDSQRPVGWNVQVERRRMEFAELATPDQFPGVLHQVAERMKGVRVTDADVERARTALIARRGQTIGADASAEMSVELGQRAVGWDRAAMERWMSGSGLGAVRARDATKWISDVCVPANAVLSLAGDFGSMNLRAFVENEFGAIPAGTPHALPERRVPEGGAVEVIPHANLDIPLGGVGLVAPALTDTLHPSFYLMALVLGSQATGMWSGPGGQQSRFRYSILDDPDLVRFFPPALSMVFSLDQMAIMWDTLTGAYDKMTVEMDQVMRIHSAVEWLLGGPMAEPVARRVRTDPALLYRVCSAGATRELWGGEAFWSEYRRRFDPRAGGGTAWASYLQDPAHRILLLYQPRSEGR